MHVQMKMPDLTTNESPIRIVRWLVQPGETVRRGQPLVEVETDKATMEVESALAGLLHEWLCQVDDEAQVGQPIAVFDVVEAALGAGTAMAGSLPVSAVSAADAPTSTRAGVATPSAGKPVGMFARNRAAAAATPPQPTALALSLAQRTAAKRLQESKQTIPHFYLQTSFDASAIVAHRRAAAPAKLAWDAYFVRAAAKSLLRFDRFCCRLDGERLVPIDSRAIGVAIDVENELFVIPIHAPADKSVPQISDEIRHSREQLTRGDQELRRIHAALMTITNLGVCNVECFIPIINPPEATVMGVGKMQLMPVARDDGTIIAQHRCTITLCVDHRIASGRYAAEFLEAIVHELENPA